MNFPLLKWFLVNGAFILIFSLGFCEGEETINVHREIVNKHDFEFTLNPGYRICNDSNEKSAWNNGENIRLLIYVHSAAENYKRRQSLRDTWARRTMIPNARIVFMMGSPSQKSTQDLLLLESALYGDIVQENFLDSYKNLTYKAIMAMKWISKYCSQVDYILKVDDDIITNIFSLMRHFNLLKTKHVRKQKTIMCLVWMNMKVLRDKKYKWYVSKEEFPEENYKPYCSGSAYLLSSDLPPIMYDESLYTKFFWIDDYYFTGMLASQLNLTHEFLNSMYIINANLVEQRFFGLKSDVTLFGHSPRNLNRIYYIWEFILRKRLIFGRANKLDNSWFIRDFKWSMDIWEPFLNQTQAFNFDYY